MNPIVRPRWRMAPSSGLLLGLLQLCCAGITAAAVPATTFTHLGTRDGLPGQTVHAVEQDAQGFMWFATGSGLARFDGLRIAVYRHAPGSTTTIADNTVRNLLRDRQDRLWAVTDAGLCHYRESTDDFSCVADPEGALRGADSVDQTQDGTLWLGGDGLIRVEPESGAVRRFDWGSASSDRTDSKVLEVHVDPQDRIWVGTLHGGLYLFDPQTASFTHVELGPREATEKQRQHVAVRAIVDDRAGRIWVGTDGGLSRLSATAELEAFYSGNLTEHADSWSLSDARISALGLDPNGSLWIGTQAGDLNRYVEASDTFRHYRPDAEQQATAEETPIYDVFQDATGLMWFASHGLDRLDVVSEQLVRHEPPKDEAGDAAARSPERLTAPGTPNVMLLDRTNTLWAAVPSRGLVRYGRSGGPDQVLYQHDAADPSSLSSNSVQFLHEDAAGRFWIGTANGLERFERDSGRSTHIGAGPEGEAPRDYRAIAEDPDGRLWLGTERGLSRYDPVSSRFDHFTTANGLPHDLVNAIAIDRRGIVWAGTESGLARVDPATGSIRTLFREQGLPDDQVLRLSIGLEGELFVTTHKGLVSLHPEDFERAPVPVPVGVTAIELSYAPLPADRRDAEGLRLGHADNVLTLRIRVFDFRDPVRNRLMYRLDGFDTDWIVADPGQRRATYTALPPGTYRFRYRGMGSSGSWHDGAQPIALTVLPAPWLTPWAFVGYAIALVVAVLLFVRLRLRRTLAWTRALETMVHQRTHELEEQSERLRQAVEAKDRLYTNVSHEFRTPLTVILGPVERMLWEEQAPKRRQHLEIVRRNAQRLLRLVEQILSLAQIDAVHASTSRAAHIDTLINSLGQTFLPLADDKGITLAIRADAPCWVSCDRDALEKIAINLISNAIKYTPKAGRIDVFLERVDGDRVELVVQDTGIGIPEGEQERVFQRFYRVGDQQESASGSGLGLALVKELSAANDARVSLRSSPGQGTTMRIAFRVAEPPAGYTEDTEHQAFGPKLAELEAANARVDDVEAVQRGKTSLPVILVIEDNADLCCYLEQVLGEGFQCVFARDGEAGVEQALQSMPDLVICDVMLPKLNGFEVTRRIKEDDRTSHVPVIMLTARSDDDSRIAGLKALADEYVTKPFGEAELRQRVDTLLSIREILRQRFAREARRLAIEELPAEIGLRDRRFLERVQQVLAAHHADPDFSTVEFASLVLMSERQMQRKLKALVNQAPRDYLRSYRLERAVALLRAGEPAGTVAFAVGFSSQPYFTSCFRAEYGTTPGQFSAAKSESSRAS